MKVFAVRDNELSDGETLFIVAEDMLQGIAKYRRWVIRESEGQLSAQDAEKIFPLCIEELSGEVF